MTTQTVLQRVYDIKTALYGLDPKAAEDVEKALDKGIQVEAGNGIFVFELVALINELREAIRQEEAKTSGKSAQRNALKRILKHAAVASPSREFLQYLIVGEKAGSKLAKAQQLGVKTLTEEEFEAMIAS